MGKCISLGLCKSCSVSTRPSVGVCRTCGVSNGSFLGFCSLQRCVREPLWDSVRVAARIGDPHWDFVTLTKSLRVSLLVLVRLTECVRDPRLDFLETPKWIKIALWVSVEAATIQKGTFRVIVEVAMKLKISHLRYFDEKSSQKWG